MRYNTFKPPIILNLEKLINILSVTRRIGNIYELELLTLNSHTCCYFIVSFPARTEIIEFEIDDDLPCKFVSRFFLNFFFCMDKNC